MGSGRKSERRDDNHPLTLNDKVTILRFALAKQFVKRGVSQIEAVLLAGMLPAGELRELIHRKHIHFETPEEQLIGSCLSGVK